MAKIRDEELAQLAGEVLPERTVLSAAPAVGKGGGLLGNLSFCNNSNQSQHMTGNLIAIGLNLPQCGFSNKGKAGVLGL
jgi:hypothetical protein